MFGLMDEDLKEIGKTTICMVEESTLGKMAGDMKVSMKMIGNTDTVSTLGTTVNNMKVSGPWESSTARVFIAKMEETVLVFGRTEKESNGWMISNDLTIF